MNISHTNTFGVQNNNSTSTPVVNSNNNDWKSVNVSNNVMKPVTRVQPSINTNKNMGIGNPGVNVNQPSLQSNLTQNSSSANLKPKVANENQGQGRVVDFRQQLTTTKKKK